MPIVAEPSVLNERLRIEQQQRPNVGFIDAYVSAFRTENTLGSFNLPDNFEKQPDYNPFDGDIEGYEQFADSFIRSGSREETASIKAKIDREMADREILSNAGWKGITAMIVTSAIDPVELAAMALTGGGSKAVSTGQLMKATFVGTGVTEGILQSNQETRTNLESGVNVAASVLTAGILGSALSRLNKREFEELTSKVEREMQPVDIDSTAGAAARDKTTLDDETLVRAKAVNFFTFGGKLNPLVRVMNSSSVTARRTIQRLSETPLLTRKNLRGVRTEQSVETLMKREEGIYARALLRNRQHFTEYRKAGGEMNYRDFNREVGKAARRNDSADDPFVDAAAKQWRPFFDNYKNRAIKLGQLDEGVQALGSDTYLTRVYLQDRIDSDRGKFNEIIGDWLRGKGVDDAEIPTTTAEIARRIKGHHEGLIPTDIVPKAGPLKERVLDIEDELIEEFLENDITVVANQYQRSMAPEILLRENFDGDKDLSGVIATINNEYDIAISKAKAGRQVRKLEKERDRTVRDIEAQRDRIIGTFGLPNDPTSAFVRVGRFARTMNYMALLGGMTISALPDMARPVFQHGIRRTMGRGVMKLFSDLDRLKLAAADVRRMGAATEIVMNTRVKAIADIGDSVGGRFDDAVQRSSRAFSVASGMVHWNDYMKRFSGLLAADNFLETAGKWANGSIRAKDIKRLAQSGIDEDMARRITAQFRKHGDDGDLRIGQSYKWDDAEAAQAFESAIIKDVDTAIVTPGIADKPLWMSSELGKTVLQFKSFGFGAVNRVFLTSLQGRDGHTLSGMLAMFAFGALTYWSKEKIAGREISDNPGTVVNNIIDRTGFFGILYDVKNMGERGTGRFLMGDQIASRFQSRSLVSNALGPSVGAAETVVRTAYGTAQGELTEADIHAARRLLPYQNLFYASWLFDAMEDEVTE